jgi:hypothetical protein
MTTPKNCKLLNEVMEQLKMMETICQKVKLIVEACQQHIHIIPISCLPTTQPPSFLKHASLIPLASKNLKPCAQNAKEIFSSSILLT